MWTTASSRVTHHLFWAARGLIVIGLGTTLIGPLAAQEHDAEGPEPLKRHHVTLFTGFTWVPKGETDETSVVIAPTVGIDYTYWFSHKFGLGVVNDFELTTYVIEDSDGTPLVREYAYVGAAVVMYEVAGGLALFGGPGVELETHENFFVVKLGVEYTFAMTERWHTGITFGYDFKDEYDSWGLGVSVTRLF
jgi:hypothetical protein